MAMISVDPMFAQKYTAVAVTHGFNGSPHIDKQNVGPFYGLALGDFEDGTGGIRVECSARVLGKFPCYFCIIALQVQASSHPLYLLAFLRLQPP